MFSVGDQLLFMWVGSLYSDPWVHSSCVFVDSGAVGIVLFVSKKVDYDGNGYVLVLCEGKIGWTYVGSGIRRL